MTAIESPEPDSEASGIRPRTSAGRLRNLIRILTGLSFLLLGYENGLFGGLTSDEWWNETFDYPTGIGMSTIVACYQLGCMLGSLLTSAVGELLGRKRTIRTGAMLMLVGAIMQTLAASRPYLIFARIISGFGMGLISSTATVLLTEVTPKEKRGQYACASISTLNFGICLSYWITYGMWKDFTGAIVFRFPIACQMFFILPIGFLTLIIPESPLWLVFHDRASEALIVLSRLEERDSNDPKVVTRFREMEANVVYEKSHKSFGYLYLFKDDGLNTRKRLLIGCSVQSFQQLGGVNAIIYHAHFLFYNSLGITLDKASLMSGLLFTWFFLASFIPWFLVDSVGRRSLMIPATGAMGVTMLALGLAVWAISLDPRNSGVYKIASTGLCFLFLTIFTVGFQSIVWFYPPEILPLRVRAQGNAMAMACSWIANFAVVEFFPPLSEAIGWTTFLIFAVLNFTFVPIMFFYYPETKGKQLEEIDFLFGDAISAEERFLRMSQIQATLEVYQKRGCDYTLKEVVESLPPALSRESVLDLQSKILADKCKEKSCTNCKSQIPTKDDMFFALMTK